MNCPVRARRLTPAFALHVGLQSLVYQLCATTTRLLLCSCSVLVTDKHFDPIKIMTKLILHFMQHMYRSSVQSVGHGNSAHQTSSLNHFCRSMDV